MWICPFGAQNVARELGGFECRDIEPLPMASLITPAPLGNETATLNVGFVVGQTIVAQAVFVS